MSDSQQVGVKKWSSTPHEAGAAEQHSGQYPLMCPEWCWVIDKLLSQNLVQTTHRGEGERAPSKPRSRGPGALGTWQIRTHSILVQVEACRVHGPRLWLTGARLQR